VPEPLPAAGMVGLGLCLGLPQMLQGWAGWQARSSRPFNPSPVCWMWLVLMLLLSLGAAVSSLPLAPALLLPPIHLLTMILSPSIMLALVGRAMRGAGGTWREVVAGLGSGGSFGVGLSLVSEGVVGFALVVVAVAVIMMTPGGEEQVSTLMSNLQDSDWLMDLTNLLGLLLKPVVAISVLGMFTIPVPLIEEACKTLAIGLAARWVRPNPARAFLWGVASGAGFALVENLFNGALGGAEGWAPGALARFGATVMHCVTGGLVGWGWGQLWAARRPLRLLGAYTAAVTIHGLWNAAAVGAVLLSAVAWAYGESELGLALAGVGMLTLIVLLGLLTVAFIFALPLSSRRLADRAEERRYPA
jgi:RsiW-degrading membrane proteinase PrsW (M82 family)